MKIDTLKSRILRLEAKRGTSQFDRLSRDDMERELFVRLHRMAAQAGGIDGLLAHWDETEDPRTLALIAKVRPYALSIRDHYAEMEARFCSLH